MKIAFFHFTMFLLHIGDLITTSRVTPNLEANSLMKASWNQYGFWMLIVLKALGWTALLLYHLHLLKKYPHRSKLIWIALLIGLALMVLVVSSNTYIVTSRGLW